MVILQCVISLSLTSAKNGNICALNPEITIKHNIVWGKENSGILKKGILIVTRAGKKWNWPAKQAFNLFHGISDN